MSKSKTIQILKEHLENIMLGDWSRDSGADSASEYASEGLKMTGLYLDDGFVCIGHVNSGGPCDETAVKFFEDTDNNSYQYCENCYNKLFPQSSSEARMKL